MGLVPLDTGRLLYTSCSLRTAAAVGCHRPASANRWCCGTSVYPSNSRPAFGASRRERWAGAPSVRWNSQTKAYLHLKKQRVYATETLDYATKTSPPLPASLLSSQGGERGWLACAWGGRFVRGVMCWALKSAIWICRLLCALTPCVSVSLLLLSPLTFYGSYIWEGRVWYCGCTPRLSVSLSLSPCFPLSMISIFSLSPSLSLTHSLPRRLELSVFLAYFFLFFPQNNRFFLSQEYLPWTLF